MTLGTVHAIDHDGKEYHLAGRERASLMEILANSLLSCQIQWHAGLDGIRLTVAPEF